MTKHSLLLALGATCLISRSAAAQEVEPPTTPKRQIRIERHIQNSDGTSHHITVIGDSVQYITVIGDSVVSIEHHDLDVDVDDMDIDARIDMDSLEEAINEQIHSLREINADAIRARHDSIRDLVQERLRPAEKQRELARLCRDAVTERLNVTREINADVKKLSKELKGKMRALQNIRILVDRDTVGLAMELESAQNAIEAAREAMESNRNALEAAREAMELDPGTVERSHDVMEQNRNAIASARWSFGKLDSSTMIDGQIFDVAHWNDDKYFGMTTQGADSSHCWISQSGDQNAPHAVFFRPFTDSANGGQMRLEPLNGTLSVNGTLSFNGNGKMVVLESDSIRVEDGKDAQTCIRIVRDTTMHGHSSRIMIITTSRNGGSEKEISTSTSTVTTDMAAMPKTTMTLNTPAAPGYMLGANRPNPFSGPTTISFTLPQPERATLTVFDATGTVIRVLKNEELAAGNHTAVFDGSGLPSGTYLYRLVTGTFSETKTMTLEK